MTMAVTGAIFLALGAIALVYALSLDATVRDFESAAACTTGAQDSACLERRTIEITGVRTGRFDEVDAVDLRDDGQTQELGLAPRSQHTSVLQTGASGIATIWRGQYTNLDVAGLDFRTDENPRVRQAVWLLVAFVGGGFAVILVGASLVWRAMNRRAPSESA